MSLRQRAIGKRYVFRTMSAARFGDRKFITVDVKAMIISLNRNISAEFLFTPYDKYFFNMLFYGKRCSCDAVRAEKRVKRL